MARLDALADEEEARLLGKPWRRITDRPVAGTRPVREWQGIEHHVTVLVDQDVTNDYLSNELNQYDDVDGTLFTYDGNGNLTGARVNTYLYDVESRLISATTPQNLADYTYDPFGRRGEKDVDVTVTRYVYTRSRPSS